MRVDKMSQMAKAIEKASIAKKEKSVSHIRKINYSQSISSPADRILFLQRTVGNQAVQRLIRSGSLQMKLRISQPNDIYEQEAERVADAVIQMPEPQAASSGTPHIQRACSTCKEEKELMTKADNASEITHDLESSMRALKGRGKPLPESMRTFYEPLFGHDLSNVRLHTGAQANELAQGVNARAFTTGTDVVFGAGQYSPDTMMGKRLLAHELTHVVQQSGIAYKLLQRRCGEDTPPAENHATIRAEIVAQAQAQMGEHYLWGTEGERPGLGDVIMHPYYQGVARVSGGCVCSGKHSDPAVSALPHMEQTVLNVEDYCLTHAFLRKEGAGDCGGGCGAAAGDDIWGECCIGHRHFDCSGFVYWSYNQAGYNISRNNVSGYQGCDRNINQADLQPGDLCYIGDHHVGIYAGGNQVVEARSHRFGVVLSPLAGRGWDSYGSLF
jgi:cell wall-associated NlpC family hydrolase